MEDLPAGVIAECLPFVFIAGSFERPEEMENARRSFRGMRS